jgi:hypothetical protein
MRMFRLGCLSLFLLPALLFPASAQNLPVSTSSQSGPDAAPVTLALAREKMPFEITPFFPHLTRLPNEGADKVALGTIPSK